MRPAVALVSLLSWPTLADEVGPSVPKVACTEPAYLALDVRYRDLEHDFKALAKDGRLVCAVVDLQLVHAGDARANFAFVPHEALDAGKLVVASLPPPVRADLDARCVERRCRAAAYGRVLGYMDGAEIEVQKLEFEP